MLQGQALHMHHEWQNRWDRADALQELMLDTNLSDPDLG